MYLFMNICGVPCVQIRLRDYGVLDFDAGDTRRQPPVDTTWQQVLLQQVFLILITSCRDMYMFLHFNGEYAIL